MRLVILGSGTSFGVPVLGCDCRVCASADPRDRRTRVAAVVEGDGGRRLLIDTPPEVRLQLLAAGIGSLEAVLYTHDHADHVHGIDDLRAVSGRRGQVPVFGPADTLDRLASRFPYIFDAGIRPPLIAAGINLFGGPLGMLHRHVTGAVPIRRDAKDPAKPSVP